MSALEELNKLPVSENIPTPDSKIEIPKVPLPPKNPRKSKRQVRIQANEEQLKIIQEEIEAKREKERQVKEQQVLNDLKERLEKERAEKQKATGDLEEKLKEKNQIF